MCHRRLLPASPAIPFVSAEATPVPITEEDPCDPRSCPQALPREIRPLRHIHDAEQLDSQLRFQCAVESGTALTGASAAGSDRTPGGRPWTPGDRAATGTPRRPITCVASFATTPNTRMCRHPRNGPLCRPSAHLRRHSDPMIAEGVW